jgi:uncharacterized membrane protein YesL
MFLNLLWILFSLPVFTIGASSTALYSVLIKMRNGREGKLLRDFWDAFWVNFRQSTVIWLIVLFSAIVFTIDIFYFVNMGGFAGTFFAMIFLGLDVVLLLMSIYVFPLQAVFDNKIGTTLKSALFLTFRHLGWTVLLLALSVLTFICVWIFGIAVLWFVFGLAAFINTGIFDRIFKYYYSTESNEQ